MKKILFIIYTHSMGGGAEKILSNVVNGLAKKTNYDISVLEYANYGIKKEKIDDRVNILKPIVDMNNSTKLERVIKLFLVHFLPQILRKKYIKENYDVEISFNYQIPSFLTSSKKSVYNIQWNHGDIYDLKNSFLKRLLQRRSFKKADKIVVISKNTRNSIIDIFPKMQEKICTIYNGTDIELLNTLANKQTDIKIKNNSIVFLGRLEPQKAPMRLIKYTEQVIREGLDINLYLMGGGPQKDEIEKYIDSHNLGENIKLLGYVYEPYPVIKQSAAICMLSQSEGFPTVFTEGMALGKPFISTRVGGTEELSNSGKCGIIIDSYDEFKDAIINVVLNKENNINMGNACIEHMELFSYDKQIEETIKLIGK